MRGSGDSIALRGADLLFSNYADFEALGALILYLMDDCCGKSGASTTKPGRGFSRVATCSRHAVTRGGGQ